MRRLVLFTDLDGSLLDNVTHSFEPARAALELLRALSIPLVLVSSKTQSEIEEVRARLDSRAPFVVENGGAVFVPYRYFGDSFGKVMARAGYEVIEFGTPYARLRSALSDISAKTGVELRGFGDMTPEELAERTGLSRQAALLAKQRAYDEPFLIGGPSSATSRVLRGIGDQELRWTRAGRFHHLTGRNDKGMACQLLAHWYRRKWFHDSARHDVVTVGVGDSLSDVPMLEQVDIPILVQRADGTYDKDVRVRNLTHANGPGPVGWSLAVSDLLRSNG